MAFVRVRVGSQNKERFYRTSEVSRILSIPERRIIWFGASGYVHPVKVTGAGKGSTRYWDRRGLFFLNLGSFLMDHLGMSGPDLKEYLSLMQEDEEYPFELRDAEALLYGAKTNPEEAFAYVVVRGELVVRDTLQRLRAWESGRRKREKKARVVFRARAKAIVEKVPGIPTTKPEGDKP